MKPSGKNLVLDGKSVIIDEVDGNSKIIRAKEDLTKNRN